MRKNLKKYQYSLTNAELRVVEIAVTLNAVKSIMYEGGLHDTGNDTLTAAYLGVLRAQQMYENMLEVSLITHRKDVNTMDNI